MTQPESLKAIDQAISAAIQEFGPILVATHVTQQAAYILAAAVKHHQVAAAQIEMVADGITKDSAH
jgi:hypothetical protein